MITKILILGTLTEALVELFFTASPLQGIRAWLIKKTPVFNTLVNGHLLECKYCTSVWIGALIVLLATFADCQATRLAAGVIIVARISNYTHLIVSSMRDAQINMRLRRQ